MLNAEGMPNFFDKYSSSRFFSRGFTGNFILLLWCTSGALLSFAFLSTIKARLFTLSYEKPLHSTKDVVLSGNIPVLGNKNSLWPKYLSTSVNEWQQKASEIGITFPENEDENEQEKKILKEIYLNGEFSHLTSYLHTAYYINLDPWYVNKTPPYFQISKETLKPYYHGWIYPKVSKWKKDLDRHILLLQQVNK